MYLIILNPYRIYSSILGLSCLPIHLASYSTHISVYLTLHLSIRQYLCLSYHLYISLSLFDSSSSRVYGPVSCCAYEYFCEYCRNFCSDCQITFGLVQLSVLIGTIVGVDWYDCRCWMVRLSVLIGTVVGVDWYGCRCWLVRLSVLIGTIVGVDSVYRTFQNKVQHSVIGIATHCGLEGPGIESRWQWGLPYPSKTSRGPSSLQYNGYSAIPGAKAARKLRLPPTPF